MVYCIRKLNWMKALPEVKDFRNYAKYNPTMFSDDLKSVDWNIDRDPSGINERQDCLMSYGLILRQNSLRLLIATPRSFRRKFVV